MSSFFASLLKLYIPLIGWMALGWGLGRILPKFITGYLGKFLFWIGVPISIIAFLRKADLSGLILIAPLVAWIAMAVGAIFAWIWIDLGVGDERIRSLSRSINQLSQQSAESSRAESSRAESSKRTPAIAPPSQPAISSTSSRMPPALFFPDRTDSEWTRSTQGSFLLAMMVGNTGYMGFPVVLNLVGADYFAWALFYDLLGTFIGVYGIGMVVANHFGSARAYRIRLLDKILANPPLWSLGIGLVARSLPLPDSTERVLQGCAWAVVNLALVLIGMQLSQLASLRKLKQAIPCLGIKMLIVPLFVGTGLMFFGVEPQPQLALVLQMGMPPAFATVVFADAYGLDQELAVTTLVFGCVALLLLLPIWVLLFGSVT